MYHTMHKWSTAQRCDSPENYKMLQDVTKTGEFLGWAAARGLLTGLNPTVAQLYNNEENATECDKMQHFSETFSDRLPLAIPI